MYANMHIYANVLKRAPVEQNKKNPARGGIQKSIGKINN